MTELGILDTPFPDANPWLSLEPFLVNGWRSLNRQTCGLAVGQNLLYWSMRLIGDESTSWQLMRGLPAPQLGLSSNLPIQILTPRGAGFAVAYSNGNLDISTAGRAHIGDWDRKGELTIACTTMRGPIS